MWGVGRKAQEGTEELDAADFFAVSSFAVMADDRESTEQIGHQVASLSRLSPPSMPNRIFGTHS